MGILGVSHFGICVTDLAQSLAFYCDVLGFSLIHRVRVTGDRDTERLLQLEEMDMELAFIELDHARVELIQFHRPLALTPEPAPFNRCGLTHLSLRVAEFDGVVARLKQAGVAVMEHTAGTHPASNSRFVFIADPDGTRIELFGAVDESAPKPWETRFGADTA